MSHQIERLRERVAESYTTMERALRAVEEADPHASGYDPDALDRAFTEARTAHNKAIEALENREALEEARAALPVACVSDDPPEGYGGAGGSATRTRGARVSREPLTYEKGNHERGFFADLAGLKAGNPEAQARMARHTQEMRVELGEQRAISTTAGAGGEFSPPLYLQDEWVALQRASRPIANTLHQLPLPPGTNSINIPKVTGGTTVAIQTDGGSVSSTDITSGVVTGAVQTIAGQQDASIQLVDLSLPGIDVVIFDDLARAYAALLDQKVISGTVTNAKGLDQVAGTNGVTYTQATPTTATLYPKLADAIRQVNTGRFLPPQVIAMHPNRWARTNADLDSTSRPLVVPSYAPGFNPVGIADRVAAESLVGTIMGLPVIIDANIPTNLGGTTNQDEILVYRGDDIYLWESEPRLRVFEDVLSGTLQVRFQVYGYMALIAGRLPKAISLITGSGLVSPSF